MTRALLVGLVAVFVTPPLVSTPAGAAPVAAKRIPAEADVVVHVDFDAWRRSRLHKLLEAPVIEPAMAELEAELSGEGVPFTVRDLNAAKSLTFWAEGGERERGALIIVGLDAKRVRAALAALDGHEKATVEGFELHEVELDDSSHVGVLGRTLVVADDRASVLLTLRALTGKGKTLASTPKAKRLGAGRGMIVAAVFEEAMADKIRREADAAVFRSISVRGGSIVAGESGANVIAIATLEGTSAEAAKQVAQLATGGLAFLRLANDDPKAAKVLDRVTVDTKGALVTIELAIPLMMVENAVAEEPPKTAPSPAPGR